MTKILVKKINDYPIYITDYWGGLNLTAMIKRKSGFHIERIVPLKKPLFSLFLLLLKIRFTQKLVPIGKAQNIIEKQNYYSSGKFFNEVEHEI